MKRMFKPLSLALCAFGAGVVGFALNRWLQQSADYRGLLPVNHPAGIFLWVISAAMLALCLLVILKTPKGSLYLQKSHSPVEALGCIAGAAAMAMAYISLPYSKEIIPLLAKVLSALAAISFLFLGFFRYSGKKAPFLCNVIIVAFFMVYPVSQSGIWGTQTQPAIYAFPILSCICLILYSYRHASLCLGQESRRWTAITGLAGIFTCLLWGSAFSILLALWVLSTFHSLLEKPKLSPMKLPDNILLCLDLLKEAGFQGYLVGGCVRDHILGVTAHDYDICSDATPSELCDLFAEYTLVRSGEKHGTIGVVIQNQVVEITTFRTEGAYSDSRHPDWVKFVPNLEADLQRRDFTVNAIAYNPDTGFADPFDGIRDLAQKTLRAVGDPNLRFREDALRILRGVRFAVRMGLTVEEKTLQAMNKLSKNMNLLAEERIFDELCKLLPIVRAEDLCAYAPILLRVLPELRPMLGFQQHSPHHAYDVFLHTAYVVEHTPRHLALRWAALLHDSGKPAVFTQDENGRGHFYDHARESGVIADEVLRRLKAPNALRDQVCFLVENHMILLEADKRQLTRRLSKFGEENLRLLIALQKADFTSKGTVNESSETDFAEMERLLEEILSENACLHIKDLALNGQDLLELGFAPGPKLGQCLQNLLDQVLEEKLPNEKDALLDYAKTML